MMNLRQQYKLNRKPALDTKIHTHPNVLINRPRIWKVHLKKPQSQPDNKVNRLTSCFISEEIGVGVNPLHIFHNIFAFSLRHVLIWHSQVEVFNERFRIRFIEF